MYPKYLLVNKENIIKGEVYGLSEQIMYGLV